MKPRNTIILLLILVVVGGYVYLTQMRTPKTGSDSSTVMPTVEPVLRLDETQVLTITVQGPAGHTSLSRASANDAWLMATTVPTLTTPSGQTTVEADPDRASSILYMVAFLTPSRVLTDVADLSPFGLAAPAWSLHVETQTGERWVVHLGDKNPMGSSYYAKREGSPTIFLISAYTGDELRGLVENPPVKPTPTPTSEPTPGPPEAEATATPAPAATP